MADIKQISFSKQEILTLMIKSHGVREGHWVLGANFTFAAMNISLQPENTDISPTGIVALAGLILERVDTPLPFSVDAAEVNPEI